MSPRTHPNDEPQPTGSDYPPFSGNTPACIKCGHEGARTHYRPTGECQYNGEQIIDTYEGAPNERLCRRCTRCDYHWDEALADQRG